MDQYTIDIILNYAGTVEALQRRIQEQDEHIRDQEILLRYHRERLQREQQLRWRLTRRRTLLGSRLRPIDVDTDTDTDSN